MRSRLLTLLTSPGSSRRRGGGRRGGRADTGLREAGVTAPNGLVRYVAVPAREDLRQGRPRRRRKMLRSTTARVVRHPAGRLRRHGGRPDARRQAARARDRGRRRRPASPSSRRRTCGCSSRSRSPAVGVRRALAGRQDRLPDPDPPDHRRAPLPRARVRPLGRAGSSPGAIVDKSEPEAMTGYPRQPVASADGTWAYTLYHPPRRAAVHPRAEHARSRRALHRPRQEGQPGRPRQLAPDAEPRREGARGPSDGDGKAMLTVPAPR